MIKSRRMRWVGRVARVGRRICAHGVMVRRPEGKKSLERRRRRWEDNIRMVLQEVGGETWIGLSWLRIGTGGGRL